MKTPKQKLEDWLPTYGWELYKVEEEDLFWWADEIWELRSVWSPEGAKAYISFLVDPQWEGNRRKGQGVWGVGGSINYPRERLEAESLVCMSLRSHPKSEFENFLEHFEEARESFNEEVASD